ncbi:ACP phosphodiesterase [Rubritalea marina]|uniref:acyl carrier protein phosphodiesterase n=1 Tax=Rubritalea marina TaxID=361055 RepID=UPI00036FF1B9|nr:ACP phosphodiesterase [Rubritalea marina]
MNYLAHIALAHPSPASQMGNFLGDFAKGTREALRAEWPDELVDGLMMHRAIDSFTDSHPSFIASKQLIDPSRRRLGGIAIDIFYDHFLSQHWSRFHHEPRQSFIGEFYQTLEAHPQWWVGGFGNVYQMLRDEDWLSCYLQKDGIQLTLNRISRRNRSWISPVANCYDDFLRHYAQFEEHFLALYPDLQQHAATLSNDTGH